MPTADDDVMRNVRRTWEDNHYRRLAALGRDHPVEHERRWSRKHQTMIDYGAPKVRLLCTRGHRLVTVQSDSGQHGGALYPVRSTSGDGRPEAGKPVVFDALWTPDGATKAKSRCLVAGCPKLTQGTYCPEHAQRPEDTEHDEGRYTLRVKLVCPHRGCSYSGTYTMVRLYMLYVVAVQHGWHELRLPE